MTAEAFALAARHHEAGNLAAAEEVFRHILQEDPAHFGATHRLGLLALQTGRVTEAVEHLTRAVRLNPDSAAAHHNLGLALRRQGLPGPALASYRRAAALQPGNEEFHSNLAAAFAEAGQRGEAIAHYQESLRLNPHRPRPHNNLGVLYAELGRLTDAEAHFRAALRLRPDYAEALVNLTSALADLGRPGEAADCCQRLLELHPDDETARFLRAALTGEGRPATTPRNMVTALFDRYAPFFDDHLLKGVNYRGPELLRAAILRGPAPRDLDVLDLGCGTGLCGRAVRDLARTLTGVDLSANMLAQARESGVYDHLIQGDILEVLKAAPAAYDLILAADLFVYVGDLAPVFPAVKSALRTRGELVCVVEAADGTDYVLRPTRRYAHSPAYIRALARSCGLAERSWSRAFLRKQDDAAVEGDVYALQNAGTDRSPR
jgi:predicted TPR repeat methyltransferase